MKLLFYLKVRELCDIRCILCELCVICGKCFQGLFLSTQLQTQYVRTISAKSTRAIESESR